MAPSAGSLAQEQGAQVWHNSGAQVAGPGAAASQYHKLAQQATAQRWVMLPWRPTNRLTEQPRLTLTDHNLVGQPSAQRRKPMVEWRVDRHTYDPIPSRGGSAVNQWWLLGNNTPAGLGRHHTSTPLPAADLSAAPARCTSCCGHGATSPTWECTNVALLQHVFADNNVHPLTP